MEILIVTGLSGAGKSQAIHFIEDMEYYCIDNMPPALIRDFVNLAKQDKMSIQKAAFVVDIRGGEFFGDLKTVLEEMRNSGTEYQLLFLEASDEVLVRRYKETRRTHPLSKTGSIREGIEAERKKLAHIRKEATYVIDTSNMKAAHLNRELKAVLMGEESQENFTITVESFGFKHGMPPEADWVFDVRFIPNPYYLASMKKLTGNSKKVQDYVLKFPESQAFVKQVHSLINELIPHYIREGKYNLVLAFGCTGGQHRSVTMANKFAELFQEEGKRVVLIHRNLAVKK
ncbi:MAG: RNase adapter RapZ [Firmicutes bacterium]|nr:RNase adapter RapZ [Bacillota bacterium]MBQ6685018.1 RNase adapter RapZ [Bacillota bacterium]MBQ6949064.1 RNase adapter RapZ [Bacillota bacterium]